MSTTSSIEETMKDLLDRGEVKPSWRDKQFVHFLDLKEAYGREFLARVKEHAESTGFSWADLARSENERRTCAKMFVDRFGITYWGTPANRQKYLQEECLADPDTLCVYPDRREEIVRTLMVLLERKAKGYARLSTEKPKVCCRLNPNFNSTSKSKRKMTSLAKETDEDYTEAMSTGDKLTYKIPRTRALSNAIRPFKAVLSDSDSSAELNMSSRKIQKAPKSKKKPDHSHPHPTKPVSTTSPAPAPKSPPKPTKKEKKSPSTFLPPPPPMGTFIHTNTTTTTTTSTSTPTPPTNPTTTALSAANYTYLTTILATSTTQAKEGMAPVWIPYEHFTSTSSFLDSMADQCNLLEWNPTMQLSREDADWFAPANPSAGSVIAASVRFEWSDFEIRVRQGHDEDWVVVQRELVRAWRVRSEGDGDEGVEFKIRVLLHVIG
ncbi:uncharacterized protein BO80DRAFT_476056 [Aspergillus ibericus CBS 121593]|uniref:Uncharacterized protein n=1 Tax=Aspergillus ibericus CBS 121593 TaxID=1448316 RepID=A0A395GYY3_9EURO|nr:hypothetical protein BO80DRAFT_476056 [Aspergillus ibericus CBS 121593]RAL00533.1 hypothetical protein BO80DRAFT_476056 [Aspergillus ibericus CBS 121593]